ncbi:MAG TPA: RNA polymerase sigma factor [Dongiaceae bacterium]|nr:RNA polymerase sigma factor [Dongiaceae bacterium]
MSDGAFDTTSYSLLVQRIQDGDSAAESEFVTQFRPRVLLIASARMRDREAAHDLTQDVLMAVLTGLRRGQLREAEKLPAYVQGTLKNLANNYLRAQQRRGECGLDVVTEAWRNPVEEREWEERRRLIVEEIKQCSDIDQKILLYGMVDGHSSEEIAKKLGLSHDAVRARKSRVIRKITEKFSSLSQK